MSERLQKILAAGGVSSRRHAESLITAGRVRVNGRIVTELGTQADPHEDRIEVDGRRVVAEAKVYALFHKPRGVVSTLSDPEGRPTVADYVKGIPGRVYPVGRLDFATSGALLVTNDGDFAMALLHPKKGVGKTYVVKVTGEMTEHDLERWRRGVKLDDGMTHPAKADLIRHENGKTWFQLTITEGRNQQVRRMGEATRFPVMRLARVSFAGIELGDLPVGKLRGLTRDELLALRQVHGVPKSIRVKENVETARPTRGRTTGAARRDAKPDPAFAKPRGPNTHGKDRERARPTTEPRGEERGARAHREERRPGAPRRGERGERGAAAVGDRKRAPASPPQKQRPPGRGGQKPSKSEAHDEGRSGKVRSRRR